MKFSIIIPVYNVYEYLEKCLKSIVNQSYDNFEVIIVNDGSPDDSQKIIDKYQKIDKRFKGYKKDNGGLSSARNYGLKYVTGDYILFIDSDDYIAKDLLFKLNKTIEKEAVDLIRFNCITCTLSGDVLKKTDDIEYVGEKVDNVITDLIRRDYVEPAWLYCYKTSFWRKYKFNYALGKIHEDYGLTPIILYNASSITSINYDGYFYVVRDGSITKTKSYDKIKKAAFDFLSQYEDMINILDKEESSIRKDVIMTYISECVISKSNSLNGEDFNIYLKKLKDLKAVKRIIPFNYKKRVKKIIANISIKLYLRVFKNN